MSALAEIVDRLEQAIAGVDAASASGPCCVRIRLDPRACPVDWLAPLRGVPGRDDESFYWSHPDEESRILGRGRVWASTAEGAARFSDAATSCEELWRRLAVFGDPGPAHAGPLLLGGFAFADEPAGEGPWAGLPGGELVLPELLLVESGGELWLTVAASDGEALRAGLRETLERRFPARAPAPAAGEISEWHGDLEADRAPEYRVRSDRSHAAYLAQVEAARQAIAEGDFEKVVLARSLRVRHDGPFEIAGLLDRLARSYPRCVTFAITRPGLRFLGATPERLVACRGLQVRTAAVAGSAPRGRTPAEDEALGRGLRESKKEQEEHAIVVRAIREALDETCSGLAVPESPRLLRIEGIQHLETPIEGTLREARSILELGGLLHPTPAVSGAPAEAAKEWIRRHEGMQRGWYAGAVGFVDREGGGELRVALRSGLIRSTDDGDEALLYAGGGLVADSCPAQELEETRVKLRALLAPLTEI